MAWMNGTWSRDMISGSADPQPFRNSPPLQSLPHLSTTTPGISPPSMRSLPLSLSLKHKVYDYFSPSISLNKVYDYFSPFLSALYLSQTQHSPFSRPSISLKHSILLSLGSRSQPHTVQRHGIKKLCNRSTGGSRNNFQISHRASKILGTRLIG